MWPAAERLLRLRNAQSQRPRHGDRALAELQAWGADGHCSGSVRGWRPPLGVEAELHGRAVRAGFVQRGDDWRRQHEQP